MNSNFMDLNHPLIKKSERYAVQLATGDYETVLDEFSNKIKKQVNKKLIEDTWVNVVLNIGAYKGLYKSQIADKEEHMEVAVILKYQFNGIKLLFMFDSNAKIDGMLMGYFPIEETPVSNDKFEEIIIGIGKDKCKLNGILTLPKAYQKSDIVIMVQGSGQSDMDMTLGIEGSKPFRDIALGLAEYGIASIRYNKRFFQHPELAPTCITIQDEVLEDVAYAIDFAQQDKRFDKIYILGHSLGAMLSPYIANSVKGISGIISLAGSPRRFEDILFSQRKDAINSLTDKTSLEKEQIIYQLECEIMKIKNLNTTVTLEPIMGICSSYWRSLNKIDSSKLCKELEMPMLLLQGGYDFQILADVDFKMWKDILKDNENAKFILYPKLNHFFMPPGNIRDIRDYNIKSHVDPAVIKDIANWINALV